MRNKPLQKVCSGLFLILAISSVSAEENWRARAFLDVAAPGIVETIVPPQLINRSDSGPLDLALTGPDGNPRAFELYWREPVDDAYVSLSPDQVTINENKDFVWEASVPEKLLIRQLIIQLTEGNVIGKIDVEGYRGGQWSMLAKNAAVFKADSAPRGSIDLPEADYERLRLYLSGFDQRARQMLSPIQSVIAMGKHSGKDFANQAVPLPFQQSGSQAEIHVEAVLPGSGLWIHSLMVKTEVQFQGGWRLGRETIVRGQKEFTVIQSGRLDHVDRRMQSLNIEIERQWQGSSLILKLDTEQRYIGAVTGIEADVRLPRLVFAAEKEGRYTLLSGTGKKAPVLNRPGDALRRPDVELALPMTETNPLWQPASLIERYRIKGAPFDPAGYTWRSAVVIAKPGYYRLALHLDAILKSPRQSIRIVKDDFQVPFIQGRTEKQISDLAVEKTFDAEKNQSQWIIRLPGPSDQWQNLTLNAEGIFSRGIRLERPKPGNMGWQPWQSAGWENRDTRETALMVNLRGLPADMDRIRVIIDNGDNQPVNITKFSAHYATSTFSFLAHQPGTYWVYGGNPQATPPKYDLSLFENELQSMLPEEIHMMNLELFEQSDWKNRFRSAFSDTGWGLYAVLGLVTLILIGMIVKLLPKEKTETGPDDRG